MKLFYDNILVGTVITNQSLTVEEALELIGFDEEQFISENGFDDIDYNDFKMVYNEDKIISEFERLGFEVSYENGTDGHGYYQRKHGTTDLMLIAETVDQLEELLLSKQV